MPGATSVRYGHRLASGRVAGLGSCLNRGHSVSFDEAHDSRVLARRAIRGAASGDIGSGPWGAEASHI